MSSIKDLRIDLGADAVVGPAEGRDGPFVLLEATERI